MPEEEEQTCNRTEGFMAGPGLIFCAFTASFFMALSPTFWKHAEIIEVYAFNSFLSALIYWLSLRLFLGKSSEKEYLLISFLFGLGMGNHHTLLLLAPSLLILFGPSIKNASIMFNRDNLIQALTFCRGKRILFHVFFFVLALSIYLYLPLRALQNPALNWGNPDKLGAFIDVFMRKGYETQSYVRSWETLLKQLKSFDPFYELGAAGIFLIITGIYYLWKYDKRLTSSLLTGILFYSGVIIFLVGDFKGDPQILTPFYMPAYIFFSIIIGAGLIFLYTKLKTSFNKKWISLVFFAFLITILFGMYSKNKRTADASQDFLAYDYGYNEMNSFAEKAIYLPKVDSNTFVLWYIQMIEKYREDVDVIPVYFLTQRWYLPQAVKHMGRRQVHDTYTRFGGSQAMINRIFSHYEGQRDIYAAFMDSEYIPPGIHSISNGLTFKLSRKEEKLNRSVWDFYRFRNVTKIGSFTGFEDKVILENYASSYYNNGLQLYANGKVTAAIRAFENALAIRPLDADTLNNLAMLYAEKNMMLEEARKMAIQAVELHDEEDKRFNALDTLGWVYFKMGRYDDAFDVLKKAKSFLTGNPSFHHHLGMTLYRLGEKEKAVAELSKALIIDDPHVKKEVLIYLEKSGSEQ